MVFGVILGKMYKKEIWEAREHFITELDDMTLYGGIVSVCWVSGRISNHEATDTFSGSELTGSRSLVCQTLVRQAVVRWMIKLEG